MNVSDVGAPLVNMLEKFSLGWHNPAQRIPGKGLSSLPAGALTVDLMSLERSLWWMGLACPRVLRLTRRRILGSIAIFGLRPP